MIKSVTPMVALSVSSVDEQPVAESPAMIANVRNASSREMTTAMMKSALKFNNPPEILNSPPLDNIDEVLRAIDILTAPWGLAWSPKRITVSSIGKLDTLRRLLDETRVHVAISVHSPFADERASLMPVQRAFPLVRVLDLLRGYDFAHQRRLSAEYIMWGGVNDDLRHADALARLLHGLDCRVNLIRFHAIPDFPHGTSPTPVMEAFRDRLNERGITATIRTSRGEDIAAACGMLSGEKS